MHVNKCFCVAYIWYIFSTSNLSIIFIEGYQINQQYISIGDNYKITSNF